MKPTQVPHGYYGVTSRDEPESAAHEIAEQVRRIGYASVDCEIPPSKVAEISQEFERLRDEYVSRHGIETLRSLKEDDVIRAPILLGSQLFLDLATHPFLLEVVNLLIPGKFVLNQQNGLINPPSRVYTQAAWHRDLPYQHFVSSTPLAVNALYCVDDFTAANGATFVIPASHKAPSFPSEKYVESHAVQLEARAGHFLILDCMTFHCGGYNATALERRAINHVYTIPLIKHQINFATGLLPTRLTSQALEILGVEYQEPRSVEEYLAFRKRQHG